MECAAGLGRTHPNMWGKPFPAQNSNPKNPRSTFSRVKRSSSSSKSVPQFYRIFIEIWLHFGRFFRPKHGIFSIYFLSFLKFYFGSIFGNMLMNFRRVEPLKIAILPSKNANFCKINIFAPIEQNVKNHPFSNPKSTQFR